MKCTEAIQWANMNTSTLIQCFNSFVLLAIDLDIWLMIRSVLFYLKLLLLCFSLKLYCFKWYNWVILFLFCAFFSSLFVRLQLPRFDLSISRTEWETSVTLICFSPTARGGYTYISPPQGAAFLLPKASSLVLKRSYCACTVQLLTRVYGQRFLQPKAEICSQSDNADERNNSSRQKLY